MDMEVIWETRIEYKDKKEEDEVIRRQKRVVDREAYGRSKFIEED